MREAEIVRKTNETDISIKLNLDGVGKSNISTGCGFLDHMLTLFASHGRFDLDVNCVGDTYVDYHHSTEDIAIALGQAFSKALGDKRGIYRYADAVIPMDESLIAAATAIGVVIITIPKLVLFLIHLSVSATACKMYLPNCGFSTSTSVHASRIVSPMTIPLITKSSNSISSKSRVL